MKDLTDLMTCKNCKFYNNGCSHINSTPNSSCNEWEENIISNEEPKIKEAKEIYRVMYYEIINILREFLVMQEFQYKIIAIWILGTYTHESFNSFPLLFFNAMRGSGKTRALKLISSLSKGGDGSVENNLTEACLFRIPRGRTTCIDEVEQIGNKEKQTLRELLNAAYKKGMKVRRMKKQTKRNELGVREEVQVAEEFEPYFPIAMANINGIEEVLEDRSLTLILEKSDDPEKTKKAENFDKNVKIMWIKTTLELFSDVVTFLSQKKHLDKWNIWLRNYYNVTNVTNITNNTNVTNVTISNPIIRRYLDNINNIDEAIPKDMETLFIRLNESGITGRNFELFMPLLILAEFIDLDIFEDIFKIAKQMVSEKKSDEYHESRDVSLYQYILTLEDKFDNSWIKVKDITQEFRFTVGDEEKEINEKWVGRALKRLNLIIEKRKMNTGKEVKLNYMKAKEKLRIFI